MHARFDTPPPLVLEPLNPGHLAGLRAVSDHFAATGFASFSQEPASEALFAWLLQLQSRGYPAYCLVDRQPPGEAGVRRRVAGYGYLAPYGSAPAFDRAAMVTLYLLPFCQRHGFGGRLLGILEKDGRAGGVETVLASIVAGNGPSLSFFAKHGYGRAGCFRGVARKFGASLDQVWLQKPLQD